MEIIKKISVGGINNVRKGFKDALAAIKLRARIVGIVRSVKWDETEFGMAGKFIGDFRAWNQEGTAYAGPVLFLPEPAQSMLAAMLAVEGAANGVEFAFDLSTVPSDSSVTGYAWHVEQLFESRVSDPMAVLMSRIGAPEITKEPEVKPQGDLLTSETVESSPEHVEQLAAESHGGEGATAQAATSRKKK